jgi:TfoX/Sxy family transcriptional regulator of competence genes
LQPHQQTQKKKKKKVVDMTSIESALNLVQENLEPDDEQAAEVKVTQRKPAPISKSRKKREKARYEYKMNHCIIPNEC